MSDLGDLHDYENKPKKRNPFRSKPIPKSRIEWAIRSTLSISAAAKYIGVSYNTFKKYAKMFDLFDMFNMFNVVKMLDMYNMFNMFNTFNMF